MTPRPGIVIRGMGLISSLGAGKSRTVEAIRGKRDGLAPVPFFPHPASENAPVCSIRDFPPDLEHRCDELAMVAIEEALAEAGIAPGSGELASCALLLGNTSVDLLEYECQFRRHVRDGSPGPAPLDRHGAILGHLADRVAERAGVGGPVLAFNTGCSASACALYQGMQLLWTGRVERVLAVGVDSLTATSFYGFLALGLLAPDGCRPFDRDRLGIQLGEGAGAVLIERSSHNATEDSAQPMLLGGVNAFDAYHPTASCPDGSAGAAAIRSALERAGIEADRIEAVKAHGTGSTNNDLAEARAMSRVFGDRIPPFTSLKRYLGHTMGASGLVELVGFVSCIRDGFVPASLGYATNDPEFEAAPISEHRKTDGGAFLFNSFGLGGSCVSLVLRA